VENWRHQPWFQRVKKGSTETLNSCGSEPRTLLVSWPDLDDSFARDCLEAYRGNRFVYVGEGIGGATGDKGFFETLKKHWKLVSSMTIHDGDIKAFTKSSDEETLSLEDSVWVYDRMIFL